MKKSKPKAKDTSTLPLLLTIFGIFLFAVLMFVIVILTDTRNKPAKNTTVTPKPTATVKPTPYPVIRAEGALEQSFLFGGDGTDNMGSIIRLSNGGFAVSGFNHKSAGTGFYSDLDKKSEKSMHANVICFDSSGKKVWIKDLSGNPSSDTESDESSIGGTIFFDIAESGDSII
ncbi:MAG TPA: hypothetical protein PLZ84_07210, partial [Clostridia bacterium]|nr:hypothetical protein [Clostridia bacterium]